MPGKIEHIQELSVFADDLLLLVEVIEAGGFTAASKRSGIPKSRLSRRIASLEELLGVCLLTRNSRTFAVTEIGSRLLQHGLQIRAETQTAITAALDSATMPSGPLRVACPIALSSVLVADVAVAFARAHPRVQVHLTTTHGTDSPRCDPYDLVIHPSNQSLPDSDLIARRLVQLSYVLVAAPSLMEASAWPMTPQELTRKPAIGWNSRDAWASWQLNGPDGESVKVHLPVQFGGDSLIAVLKAALAGLGIARLPWLMCRPHVEAEDLRIVTAGWAPAPMSIYVLYSSRRQLSLAGKAFIDTLSQAMITENWGEP